jgi:hypothetical protein
MTVAVLVALLPVSAFLLVLVLSDSFKLVSRSMLIRALLAGAGAAAVSALINHQLLASGLDSHTISRYIAPVVEECFKAIFVLYAVRQRKVGFLVDAAIVGFAVGTGFALVENIEYLSLLGAPALWLWVARGFGHRRPARQHHRAGRDCGQVLGGARGRRRGCSGSARTAGRHRPALRLQPLAGASAAGGYAPDAGDAVDRPVRVSPAVSAPPVSGWVTASISMWNC